MRASDLQGKLVRDADGRTLGRVAELHIRKGQLMSVICGRTGWLQRFTSSRAGHRIPWRAIAEVSSEAIILSRRRRAG